METLKDKDFSLIEDFISGNLSSEEEKIFRRRLEKEKNLAKAYRFRSKIVKYWNEADSYITTKENVKEILKKEKHRKKRVTTFYYAAASIVILIGITIYIRQTKRDSFGSRLTNVENDTSTSTISSVSVNRQPEKGSQYVIPPEYTTHDTLIIKRTKNFMDTEKIFIKRAKDTAIIKKYVFEPGEDSLLIPLKEIKPGNYQWILAGSEISGSFILKENSESKQ